MRATEFLREYRRDVTARTFGSRLAATARRDRSIPQGFRSTEISDEEIAGAILGMLEDSDPTPNKQYTPWLAKMYVNGAGLYPMEDIKSTAMQFLTKFHKLKSRNKIPSPRNDIMRYDDLGDFYSVVDEYPDPDEKPLTDKGEAKEVYSDANVRVVEPEDQTAACYYGQGTRWCTAATEGANYFNHYNKQGKLYILLPKKTKHDGEKYQLHFGSDQFMNEGDDPIDVSELLHNRFPSLIEFFTKVEPGLKNLIVFAPDTILKPICNKVAEIAEELIWDTLTEWEMNDDYYQIWRKEEAEKRGYVDSEGEVDWEKVYDDDDLNNYLQYSDEAHQYYNQAMECIQLTPHQAKQLAKVYAAEVGESPRITDYDRMIAGNIVENMGKHDADLADKIERTVMITSTPDGYQVKYAGRK